jgi:hypothetical protein
VVQATKSHRVGWATGTLFSFVVAAYAFVAVALPHLRPRFAPFAQHLADVWHGVALMHFAGGGLALAVGALQFSRWIRLHTPAVHRWLGRTYVIAVLVGGFAGMAMSTAADGGIAGRLGFGVLAIVWLYTTVQAYFAIRQREIDMHRAWMFRSFSLTFAAVTLRVYLPLAQMAGVSFDVAYPIIAWACWVPNLFIAWRFAPFPVQSPPVAA